MDKEKEMALKYGLMVPNILESGSVIRPMVKEFCIMQMEMFMRDSGLMIKQADREFIPMETGLSMLVSGKMINRMDLVNRNGQTDKFMKDSIVWVPKTEKVY
jgi:hypothetical protein